MSDKGEGKSQVYAEILGEAVKIVPSETAGFLVLFDKKPTQASAWLMSVPHYILHDYYRY